jgi:5-methylcytosine-specific restriction enzyme B
MEEVTKNYLREYAKVANDFLKNDGSVVERHYKFFKDFLKKENLKNIEWADLQEMGNHIHSFNSMAIAKGKALGSPNQTIEKYRESLLYLGYGSDPIDVRINNVQLENGYSLPFFGRSALSELACYSDPENYLFINTRDVEAAKFLGIKIIYPRKSRAGDKFLAFNKAIAPLLESYKEIVGKRTNTTIPLEVDQFLSWIYKNYVPDEEEIIDEEIDEAEGVNYWIFAPGKDANKWDEFYDQGVMGIGWEFIGDIRNYKSKAELVKKFQEHDNDSSSHKNDVSTCWSFCYDLKVGDIIISKKGRSKYLGYGVVESEYIYSEDVSGYSNIRKVRWVKRGEWTEPDGDIVLKTLTNITRYNEYVNKLENLLGIETGENIEDILKHFLTQSETENLKTSEYPKSYKGLNLKVSFGQGNTAKIPWISFLGNSQTTSNGIYPVYLLFKEFHKLILAYGVSETNIPKQKWKVDTAFKTISQYFGEAGIKPDRYGESYVYQVYDLTQELNWPRINSDLSELIKTYKLVLQNNILMPKLKRSNQPLQIQIAKDDFNRSGLRISDSLVTRFISSILSKQFVILTGLSGSGKTKLAQAFARWICENEYQYKIIPVGADWTNREPLFGYPNALENEKYILPDNGTLSLILEAAKEENQSKPYFLILDEMNLSHVERYFADFLSAMESGEAIPLHNGSTDWHGVPSSIKLPKNLFVIGTVNIDETTYMFSPKVLDRGNVIEFRVTEEEMSKYLGSSAKLDLGSLSVGGASMGASFVEIASDKSLTPIKTKDLNDELLKFFVELKKCGAEFGYRSASEINRFAAVVNKLEPSWELTQIIDAAIMQKLLPKVHGSRKKLEPVLRKLAELCLNDASVFMEYIKNGNDGIGVNKIKYPVSMEKIGRMYRALIENSFTSYAEA